MMQPVKKHYKDTVTAQQLVVLAFTGLFSPLIWLLPHTASVTAGAVAVFSPFFAIVPLLFLGAICLSFAKHLREGEGLADLIFTCLGSAAGRIVCSVFLLWFIFYGAVNLRSSCERFLSTIFPGGTLWVFLPITLGISVIGAYGKVRSLAGSAQIFLRLILPVLALIFIFTLPKVDKYNLLGHTYKDIPPAALGGLAVANAISPAAYILFLAPKVKDSKLKKRTVVSLVAMMLLVSFFIILTIIGNFGVTFTNTMQNPFFTMIRNISFFDVVERWEAVIVAMWVLTDFVFLSVLLSISKTLLTHLFPKGNSGIGLGIISAAVFILGMFIESSAFSFANIARTIAPAINAAMVFGLLPLVWLIGKLRKKL